MQRPVCEDKENTINHVDLLSARGFEDFLYAGFESEAFFEAVDWQLSNCLQENIPHCYDCPLQCPFCELWLRNQVVLHRHFVDPQHCVFVQGLVHSMLKKRQQCAKQKRVANTAPQFQVLEVELALLSQLHFYFSFPLGTPVLCGHCHTFFPGGKCLVEHLEIITGLRSHPKWLKKRPVFQRYGDFVSATVGLEDRERVFLLPGIDIKFPILSGECTCIRLSHAQTFVRPDRLQFRNMRNLFRWYALTSAAVLCNYSQVRMLKRLYELPKLTVDPSVFLCEDVLLYIFSFNKLTRRSGFKQLCELNTFGDLVVKRLTRSQSSSNSSLSELGD